MTYAPAAPEFERLPWLTGDSAPEPAKRLSPLIPWSFPALVLIAGLSYWVGLTNSGSERALDGSGSTTIHLPKPIAAEPKEEQVSRPEVRQVEPVAPPPPVTIARPRPNANDSRTDRSGALSRDSATRSAEARAAARASALPKEEVAPRSEPLTLWPAAQSEGAAGRAVRIGAFSSRLQAKRGWGQLVRTYPGMGRLKAVVVPSPSLRDGRTYYRLQFGTTSQAHSAVLCQWMRRIAQSCIVIGQPAQAS